MLMRQYVYLFSLLCLGASAHCADVPLEDNPLFGAIADDDCDPPTSAFGPESAVLAAWAAKFAVNAVVGFGASLLDKATEASSVVRTGTAPGFFYRWSSSKKAWLPEGGCVRFWYGRQKSLATEGVDYGPAPSGSEPAWKRLAARWSALGLSEAPHLYGEIRIVGREADNLILLQPVVLFARRLPEAEGLFRKPTRLAIGIDLRGIGADTNLASQIIELPEVASGPILIRQNATRGLASGWAVLPAPPREPSKSSKDVEAGAFTAFVSFTSASDGTLFGKTVASTFKAQKDELTTVLTPQSKAQKAEEQQRAIAAAFDAVAAVLDAQVALDTATEATKPRLALDLQKAQYIANLRLQAAGLPPRYAVNGP